MEGSIVNLYMFTKVYVDIKLIPYSKNSLPRIFDRPLRNSISKAFNMSINYLYAIRILYSDSFRDDLGLP